MPRPRNPVQSATVLSQADRMREGEKLLSEAEKYLRQIEFEEDPVRFKDTGDIPEEYMQIAIKDAQKYLDWGNRYRKTFPVEADQLLSAGNNIRQAVFSERSIKAGPSRKVKLKEQRAASSGQRPAAPVDVPVSSARTRGDVQPKPKTAEVKPAKASRVKKAAKQPKVKKVKVPKVPKIRKKAVMSPEDQAKADKAAERRQGFKERRAIRQSAFGQEQLPQSMIKSMRQYIEDYIRENKDGDSAVARVVRDKLTGQFKRVPGGVAVYQRGGIVGISKYRAI